MVLDYFLSSIPKKMKYLYFNTKDVVLDILRVIKVRFCWVLRSPAGVRHREKNATFSLPLPSYSIIIKKQEGEGGLVSLCFYLGYLRRFSRKYLILFIHLSLMHALIDFKSQELEF